jgi:hypothetical protein
MGIVQGPDGQAYWVEQGVPPDYAARGAQTVSQYQTMASQDLSDKQIQAQAAIAQQQQQLNERQFEAQQQQYTQQQSQVDEQARRQADYDTGRAQLLGEGTQQINNAFARFSPDYFNQYARDYMAKAQDQIDYQQRQAQKDLGFALARQGLGVSQAGINQQGLLQETAGRATAEQTANAQQAAANLQANVAGAKQNLQTQLTAAESIGSPIAGSSPEAVNQALQTQRSAISGVTNAAGDVTSSLSAVPTVNTLSNIFSGVLGSGGALLGGLQAAQIRGQFDRGFAGTNPSGSSTSIRT